MEIARNGLWTIVSNTVTYTHVQWSNNKAIKSRKCNFGQRSTSLWPLNLLSVKRHTKIAKEISYIRKMASFLSNYISLNKFKWFFQRDSCNVSIQQSITTFDCFIRHWIVFNFTLIDNFKAAKVPNELLTQFLKNRINQVQL